MRAQTLETMEPRWLFAVVVPSGFTDEQYEPGLSSPTAMEFAPDGRLFVTQQGGAVRVIDAASTLLATPFVSLDVDSVGERGILGIAFDPAFLQNGFVYLYYTVPNGPDGSSGANNRVSRFTAVDADGNSANGYQPGNTAAPGSEFVLLNLNPLTGADNHHGGALHFSPTDGKLYLAVGENATMSNAQTLNNHHGKILRMNSDGTAPSDNPFNNQTAPHNEPRDYIWALGLRNPFTTAFDPATGRFHINDVGGSLWEEVNEGIAGANYGWPTYEGEESDPSFGTPPLFAYPHSGGVHNDTGDVISGGTFYRPRSHAYPSDYTGDYFFAEAGHGWIRRYDVATDTATLFAHSASYPVDLKTGNDGALYYLERGSNSVRRIRSTTLPGLPSWLAPGSSATWNGTTLNVFGGATITANPGADSPLIVANTGAASLTVNPGAATQINVSGITLSNGATLTVTNAPTDRVLVVNAAMLNITGTSFLNLTDNDLVLDYAGASPIVDVEADVRGGYNVTGDWLGSGIRSSAAASDGNFTLAVADNAQLAAPFGTAQGGPLFSGVNVDLSTVLIKFTHRADVNLDGRITPDDSAIFGGNYDEGQSAVWATGDMNFDGLFTPDDSAIFGGAYDESLPVI